MPKPLETNQFEAFTLLELLTVISILAVLESLLLPSALRTQESARRTKCRNNLHQIGVSLLLYAESHNGFLPDCTTNNARYFGTWWPWDMNTNLISDLSMFGSVRDVFYCPSNSRMNDDKHWNFWKYYAPSPIRVTGYAFLLNGGIQTPTNLWRIKVSDSQSSELEMIVDATISKNGSYTHVQGVWNDRTSHLNGSRPAGGNIAFEDGHVDWRDHRNMRIQINGEAKWEF
jgi:type II secretory pathway pseudopilin PulG